jgi:hypothetical protein
VLRPRTKKVTRSEFGSLAESIIQRVGESRLKFNYYSLIASSSGLEGRIWKRPGAEQSAREVGCELIYDEMKR